MSNMNICDFAKKFARGDFDKRDVNTQIDAGWYDWFCRESSLANKTDKLGRKVIQLMHSRKVNPLKMYVFFKNNCPCNGPLYDDFRFCDIETGDVQYTITPKSGHSGKAEVWGRENDFNGPLVQGSWKDVKNFFDVR